jgi:UDP-3-O-[3-hydroxymyristoyl] glucosamine N-acyltransferase
MPVTSFFRAGKPIDINGLCELAGLPVPQADSSMAFGAVAALGNARAGDITYLASPRNREHAAGLNGVAIFCTLAMSYAVPASCLAIIAPNPALAFNRVARALYPDSLRAPVVGGIAISPDGAFIHPEALLEDGVSIAPGAVVAAGAKIGRGTRIGAGALIGPDVAVGRNCDIGAAATVLCSYLGDNVLIGPGARIGHDGFGHVPGPGGLEKVPQLGRVIVQNSVEIGANTCIDRGSLDDTVIGEGTKIDNLVQIAHNVRIGRNCAIAAHTGISGSCVLGDNVMIGGGAGLADHVTVGAGAMVAAAAGVMTDIPPGARYVGAPAKPAKEFFREVATLRALSSRDSKPG